MHQQTPPPPPPNTQTPNSHNPPMCDNKTQKLARDFPKPIAVICMIQIHEVLRCWKVIGSHIWICISKRMFWGLSKYDDARTWGNWTLHLAAVRKMIHYSLLLHIKLCKLWHVLSPFYGRTFWWGTRSLHERRAHMHHCAGILNEFAVEWQQKPPPLCAMGMVRVVSLV